MEVWVTDLRAGDIVLSLTQRLQALDFFTIWTASW